MHIGILGTGFGKYHGEQYIKIDPSIQLTFWGRDENKLKGISTELNCAYTTDLNEFLSDSTFDFIDICLPTHLHAEYALKAIRNGHSVLIETPAVASLKEGFSIIEAAKEAGKKVLVDMFLRYDPYYRMLHDLKQIKKYGALKHLAIYRRTPPFWGKLGSDTIATALMIHDLDFAAWLSEDLKLISSEVTTNSDNSGAVIDCLLADSSLKIHVQGNSMRSFDAPFSVGYEATFEHATISYYENSSEAAVESDCIIYSEGKSEKVVFELEEHCKALLRAALRDFKNEEESGLTIDHALPSLAIAFELTKKAKIS
jgi:predicted dehydrogenase